MADFPCGICQLECTDDCLECGACKNWIQRECVPMSEKVFKSWNAEKLSFRCSRCVFAATKTQGLVAYDCSGALDRIKCALESGANGFWALKSERLMLETYNVQLPTCETRSRADGVTCQTALELLLQIHPAVLEDHRPVQVNGDGNCFYRALCRALYGHEDCHLLLRLLIALEIGEYPRYYSYGKRSYVDLIKDFRIVLSDWHELMLMTATVGAYAGMQHFYAASAVLQMALYSYCPPSNNPEALSKPYTRIVRGRGVGASRQYEHIIMWSMMCPPKAIKDFMPNHFVVLSKSVPPCHDFVELTSHTPSDYPPLSPRANQGSLTHPAVKPCARRKEMARVDVVRCPSPPPVQPSGRSKGKKAKVEASRCPLVVEPSQKRMGYNSSAPFDPSLSPVQGDMSGLLHSSVSFGHSVSTPRNGLMMLRFWCKVQKLS